MLKSIVDQFDNTKRAVNWLNRESPDEEIVFASSAKVIESSSITPPTWYQRLSERPVILMITKKQLVLKNVLISPITVFYTLVIITFLSFFIMGRQWSPLLLALLAIFQLVQLLPYQHKIPYEAIRKLLIDSRDGSMTELMVDTEKWVFHVRLAQTMSPKVLRLIDSRTKTVMTS